MTVRIRPAVPGDAAGIARVNGDAWRAAYRGIFPDAVLEARGRGPDSVEGRRKRIAAPDAVVLVAEEDGDILGFAMSGPSRAAVEGCTMELYAIYVHPSRQGAGLGRRLMLRTAEVLAERGTDRFFLWTLRDLPPTRTFYEKLGGRVVAERREPVAGVEVDEVAYGWEDLAPILRLRVRVVDPDPAWPALFEGERVRIAAALGEEAAAVEHIGSTAVPGLPAKPTLDVLVGLRRYPPSARAAASLAALGLRDGGENGITGRWYFDRPGEPALHLHACLHGEEFWRTHLLFRDRLRAGPALAAEYGALKRRLAAEVGDDRLAYLAAKAPFIEGVLRRR